MNYVRDRISSWFWAKFNFIFLLNLTEIELFFLFIELRRTIDGFLALITLRTLFNRKFILKRHHQLLIMCLQLLNLDPQIFHNNILKLFIFPKFLNFLMCLVKLLPLTSNDFRLLRDDLLLHAILFAKLMLEGHHFLILLLNYHM